MPCKDVPGGVAGFWQCLSTTNTHTRLYRTQTHGWGQALFLTTYQSYPPADAAPLLGAGAVGAVPAAGLRVVSRALDELSAQGSSSDGGSRKGEGAPALSAQLMLSGEPNLDSQ